MNDSRHHQRRRRNARRALLEHQVAAALRAAQRAPMATYDIELLRVSEVLALFGLSRTSFYRLCQNNPDFPSPVRLSAFSIRFRKKDLAAWISKRQAPPGAAA